MAKDALDTLEASSSSWQEDKVSRSGIQSLQLTQALVSICNGDIRSDRLIDTS
jgi:hypothetical protein